MKKELKNNPTSLRSFNPLLGYHLTCIPEKQPHGRVIFLLHQQLLEKFQVITYECSDIILSSVPWYNTNTIASMTSKDSRKSKMEVKGCESKDT